MWLPQHHQCLILLLLLSSILPVKAATDPDEQRSLFQLIASRGFLLLSYPITTEDGYILILHRIVPPDFREALFNPKHKPVIVQHGLSSSSANFFTNSPFLKPQDRSSGCGDNFGFCLALTGRYDVWLPNSRGNDFSKRHANLSSLSSEYWRFSWEQMATKDVPAVVDFVRNKTKHHTVGWVGHSQGATMMFALLTLQPKYAEVVQPFVAWAPPVFIGDMVSGLRNFAFIERILFSLGGEYILPTIVYKFLNQWECTGIGMGMCAAQFSAAMGESTSLNATRLKVYNRFYPSGTSSWTMVHHMQLFRRNDFCRFDYGSAEANSAAYGSSTEEAPTFDMSRIPRNFTIALMYGNTDAVIPITGIARLKQALRHTNLIDYKIPKEKWNHADFLFGMGSGGLVYDKTIEILDKYTKL